MTVKYQYYKNERYLVSRVLGKVVLDEVIEYMNEVIADDNVDGEYFEIVDFSKAVNFDFGYYQTDRLMQKLKEIKERKAYLGSCLIVDDRKFVLGMANMFSVVGDSKDLNIFIFESYDEAVEYVDGYFA